MHGFGEKSILIELPLGGLDRRKRRLLRLPWGICAAQAWLNARLREAGGS